MFYQQFVLHLAKIGMYTIKNFKSNDLMLTIKLFLFQNYCKISLVTRTSHMFTFVGHRMYYLYHISRITYYRLFDKSS